MSSGFFLGVAENDLARICARYRVRELAVFGSAARGELRPDSDVDLLVVFDADAKIGLITLGRLQRELADVLGRPVDLVPRDGLKPALKDEVLADARTVYAA
jgi:uncharacterized protein